MKAAILQKTNNDRMRNILITLVVSIVGISCSPTLKVISADPATGKLPTETHLSSKEIITEKSISLKDFNQFLFVRKGRVNSDRYDNYVYGTLKNIGVFKQFFNQNDLEQYVIKNGLTDKVSSLSDNIGLHNLSMNAGNFLICETSIELVARYDFTFELKIINPVNAEILFDVKHYAVNWAGLDRPLFNPVFNEYMEWLKKNNQ